MIRQTSLALLLMAISPISACVDATPPAVATGASVDERPTLGSSFATAVVINEATEFQGVPAVYTWLRVNRPGWTVTQQALAEHNGKPYDIMTISKGGRTEEVYFDISKFFGKI